MIPVTPADEPDSFDYHVRQRGAKAIQRLLGTNSKLPGRKPKVRYSTPEEIPSATFPTCWTDVRKSDGKSTLDDMMDAYGQFCAYLAMRIERATGSPTVDHFVSKEHNWTLVYEWLNYRLSASCVNGAKGTGSVVDPFHVQPGWFALDLDTFLVRRGPTAPGTERSRIDQTLPILNLRQCVAQRGEFITRNRNGLIDLAHIQIYAPFIAAELRRQDQLLGGDS